jgi:hypothetical protein
MADNPFDREPPRRGGVITEASVRAHVNFLNSLDFVRASGRPYFVAKREEDGEIKYYWDRYTGPANDVVELTSSRERAQAMMESVMYRLRHGRMTQEQVDQLSNHNKRVAEARGLLMIVDEQYRLRPSLRPPA